MELDLNRIYLFTNINNTRAQHVYEKNGFLKEGLLRQHRYHKGKLTDYVVYSILKSEWEQRRK